MSRILYTWELGGGLGHVTRIYPILLALEQRGHQVIAAIREQGQIDKLWPNLKAAVHRAPHKTYPTIYENHPVKYFTDILYNIGWGEAKELRVLLYGWEQLYGQVRPDFVIHDHSPTAALRSQAEDIPHATLGTGFCSPPDESPNRLLRTWTPAEPEKEQRTSAQLIENLNSLLPSRVQLNRPTEVYSRVTENFLTTFPELDHFGARAEAKYWGIPNATAGARFEWPGGNGPKMFAYLHGDKSLPGVLQAIEKLNFPSLVYISGITKESVIPPLAANVRVVREQVDLAWAAQECSLGILNGSHGATAAFLLAGRPIIQLPIHLEQYLGAKRSVELGAALIVDRTKPDDISSAMRRILTDPQFAIRADEFRDRYRNWSPGTQSELIVDRIEEILKK